MFCSSAPCARKRGHSAGPRPERAMLLNRKGSGVSKRTWCRQPNLPVTIRLVVCGQAWNAKEEEEENINRINQCTKL